MNEDILRGLRTIVLNGPSAPKAGICFNLGAIVPGSSYRLGDAFESMGLDRLYPLGDYMANRSLMGRMWDVRHEEGRARWAMVGRLISYFEEQVRLGERQSKGTA